MTNAEIANSGLRALCRAGITISTAAEFIRNRRRAGVYCAFCDRWADLRLAELVMRGLGDRPLTRLPLRCRDCGGIGQLQVRPPTPKWGGASWSMRT